MVLCLVQLHWSEGMSETSHQTGPSPPDTSQPADNAGPQLMELTKHCRPTSAAKSWRALAGREAVATAK